MAYPHHTYRTVCETNDALHYTFGVWLGSSEWSLSSDFLLLKKVVECFLF